MKLRLLESKKEVGSPVKSGELLFHVEANKTNMEIYADGSGIVHSIEVKEGDIVQLGDILAKIDGEKTQETQQPVLSGDAS